MLRLLLFMLMGIGLLGFGLFGWRALHRPPVPAPVVVMAARSAPVMLRVLVAAHDLAPGAFVRPDDLTSFTMSRDAAPAGSRVDTPSDRSALVGAMVRRPISHEAALDIKDLLLPADHGFLATILAPGMRAFTIPSERITSDAGLIWPGDRLDLILTQQMPSSMAPDRQVSAETVLVDLRVLAIDRQLVQPLPPDERPGREGSPASPVASAVTVEVTPLDAERLAVALHLGKVAFAIRAGTPDSTALAGRAAGTDTVWAGGVMHALSQVRPPPPATSLHVFEGVGDKEYNF